MMTPAAIFLNFESVPIPPLGISMTSGRHEETGIVTRQSPQRLKVLREPALVEKRRIVNRIEGVEVDQSRIATHCLWQSLSTGRDEEEVRDTGRP